MNDMRKLIEAIQSIEEHNQIDKKEFVAALDGSLEQKLRQAYEAGYYRGGSDTEEHGKSGGPEDAEDAFNEWRASQQEETQNKELT